MISIQSAMMVALGFFAAALVSFLVAPFYRRRAARLATEALKRSMPLTAAEIRADKDRLRAGYAIAVHKLETRLDEQAHAAAKQMVEINRRDAMISALEGERTELKAALEGHENARRVLEQTIVERLPKVESRLGEAKKLLFQRDREIAALTQNAGKQQQALDEVTQINAQLRDEIHRVKATMATRSARGREAAPDARFETEVALRSEIEALRAKTRDQSALISRLQGVMSRTGARSDIIPGLEGSAANDAGFAGEDASSEVARLKRDLADAEVALKAARGAAEAGQADQSTLEADLRALRAANADLAAELASVKAKLSTYEAGDIDAKAIKESKIAMKAELSALEAERAGQAATIKSLRAEIAAANERMARQAQHFMSELKRLGAGTAPVSGPHGLGAAEPAARRRTLADRITDPREAKTDALPAAVPSSEKSLDAARASGFLRALNGAVAEASVSIVADGKSEAPADAAGSAEAPQPDAGKPARRPGLLERITGLDKPAATGN